MSTRLLIITVIVILIIGGLTAGLFAGTIEHALMLPNKPQPAQGAIVTNMPTTTQRTPTMPTQMPVNTIAHDTFQRQNQPLWGMASDTRQWDGDANNPNDRTIFTITNQTGQIANSQGTFNALLGPTSQNVDVLFTGQINRFAGGANLGAVLRWKDPNNWYKALIDGTRLRLIKNVQGTSSTIGSFPFPAQAATAYTLRFRAIGPMLFVKAWLTGTPEPTHWQITLMDNDLDTGQAGIRVLLRRGTIVTITSFQATTASNSM